MRKLSAEELAAENLARVVKAVNGKVVYHYMISFRLRGYRFQVGFSHAWAWKNKKSMGCTCFCLKEHPMLIPVQERQASAILLLHHNPKLFCVWRDHPGYFLS